MSRIAGLVPANFRDRVRIRDNVPANVRKMCRKRRLAVWSTIRSMFTGDLFSASRVMKPGFRAADTKGALVIYGGVTCAGSHAVLMIKDRVLHVLSVIDLQRLERSQNVHGCYIVDELHVDVEVTKRVCLRVTPFKDIIWSLEFLVRRAQDFIERVGGYVFQLDVVAALKSTAMKWRGEPWRET